MSPKSFKQLFQEAERSPVYWTERAVLRASEEIFLAMERHKVSRAELARRLGTSKAYVTKILRGDANFTLETLAGVAFALEGELKIHVAPRGMQTRWFDVQGQASQSVARASYEQTFSAQATPAAPPPAVPTTVRAAAEPVHEVREEGPEYGNASAAA